MVDKIWYKNSGHSSELVTQLPVKTASPYTRKVVYSIALPALAVGDVVQVMAHYEITNPATSRKDYNVMSGRGAVLGVSATDTVGVEIMEDAAENISWAMHHQVLSTFGSIVITEELAGEGKFANVIGFAGGSATYWQAGDYLQVEQDYGRCEVFVYPAAMVELG